MDRRIEAFLEMLVAERGAALNTRLAYEADLTDFASFAAALGQAPARADAAVLQAYMANLARVGLAARTAARRLSALRQFHRFLLREGVRTDDPTSLLDAPRLPRVLPKYLTEAEVDALLAAAEGAVSAYAHLTGSEWTPYTAPSTAPKLSRASATAQLGAFGG